MPIAPWDYFFAGLQKIDFLLSRFKGINGLSVSLPVPIHTLFWK